MKSTGRDNALLTFSEKVTRLVVRSKDPEWRRYGKLLLAGKLLGVTAVFAIMLAVNIAPILPDLLTSSAHATDEVAKAAEPLYPTVKAGDIVNPLNTLWVLLAAFLVFGMQVGFTDVPDRTRRANRL